MASFKEELEELINKHSLENESNTPDWVLAQYINLCLEGFTQAIKARDKWYGISPTPGEPYARC